MSLFLRKAEKPHGCHFCFQVVPVPLDVTGTTDTNVRLVL
nr:MAG TPA: hypothetical protein [Microviridae sp.]